MAPIPEGVVSNVSSWEFACGVLLSRVGTAAVSEVFYRVNSTMLHVVNQVTSELDDSTREALSARTNPLREE